MRPVGREGEAARVVDEAVWAALPIFPLPDIVLFPGALLPLHVFEPRYRAMTADILAGARVLAIARLVPGFENDYYGRPPVYATVGVGELVSHQTLHDGRSNILLRGVARGSIQSELAPDRPYRQVRAKLLPDRDAEREELHSKQLQLVAVCDHLATLLPEGGDMLRQLVRAVHEPGLCADVVAAAVVLDADDRQGLLETLDPVERLERVIEQTSQLLSRFKTDRQPN
jgi:Lon protease-like protein